MPRPRSFDTDAIIDRLCDYFWEHGYSAASLDDLARQLGVKRGSLFNAFGSKEVLFHAAFERYQQVYRLNFETPNHGARAIADYFEKSIVFATNQGMGRGCFLVNLLMSREIPTPELQRSIDSDVAFIRDFFDRHLTHARQEEILLATISIDLAVDALFGASIGIFALARMRATPQMIKEFVDNNLRGLFSDRIGGKYGKI